MQHRLCKAVPELPHERPHTLGRPPTSGIELQRPQASGVREEGGEGAVESGLGVAEGADDGCKTPLQ